MISYLTQVLLHKPNLDLKQELDPLYGFSKAVKGTHKL